MDYLQLMQSKTQSENRVQEISKISRDLKALAREKALYESLLDHLISRLPALQSTTAAIAQIDVLNCFVFRQCAEVPVRVKQVKPSSCQSLHDQQDAHARLVP